MKSITLRITVENDPESGWLIATCAKLPGFVTQAATEEELFHNIKEAVSLWLEVEQEKKGKGLSIRTPGLS